MKSIINQTLLLLALGVAMLPAKAEASDRYTANKQDIKSSVQYRCMEREGIPATVAYTSRGPIELIRWQNDYFSASEYTPDRRCQEVSTRFQQHSDADNLRFISTGTINNYQAICISEDTGECKPDGLLLTLQAEDDPEAVLRDLFSLEARRTGGGLTRSSGRSGKIKETVDLDSFLTDSPTVEDSQLNNIDGEPNSDPGKAIIESPFDGL